MKLSVNILLTCIKCCYAGPSGDCKNCLQAVGRLLSLKAENTHLRTAGVVQACHNSFTISADSYQTVLRPASH